MRVKIAVLALIAVLFAGMNGTALAGNSFNFLGQATWEVTITEREIGTLPEPQIVAMTGAISKLGPSYYLFQGVVQIPDDNPFFLSGGGTLVTLPGAADPTLVMTLTTSQLHNDPDRDSGVMHVEINPSDLSGTFYEIGHDFDTSNRPNGFSQRYTAGTLGPALPFIPLNPGTMAPQLPLLLD